MQRLSHSDSLRPHMVNCAIAICFRRDQRRSSFANAPDVLIADAEEFLPKLNLTFVVEWDLWIES